MTPEQRERVHAAVAESRAAQQLPETVEDPAAVSIVVAQLRATPCPSGRVPGGEPPSRETDLEEGIA